MIKITLLKGVKQTNIMGLRDGDVIDVSSGQIRLVPSEKVKTYSCGCTIVDGEKEIFLCKEGTVLSRTTRELRFLFLENPTIRNEDLLIKAMEKFRSHLNK